jgi:hypothetical protein
MPAKDRPDASVLGGAKLIVVDMVQSMSGWCCRSMSDCDLDVATRGVTMEAGCCM